MKRILYFLLLFLASLPAMGQAASDTTQPVEILPGTQRQRFLRLEDGTELQILAGTVGLRQGRTLFYCDSLVLNSLTKVFEAFGNVRIIDDTTRISSDYLRYLTDRRYAYLQRNVRLTDGRSTVVTNELEYDVATKLATYRNGGKVTVGQSVVTSREGVYYGDTRDMNFNGNVEVKDPSTYVKTESMIYNTNTRLMTLVTDTYIRDKDGRVIRTKEGVYDPNTRMATFSQRTSIDDKCLRVVGDRIANDDATGTVQIEGNAVLIDTCQGVNILANRIFANKRTESYLATRQPVMIIKQEKDSLFVAADTLYSARLTDLAGTVAGRRLDSLERADRRADSTAAADTLVLRGDSLVADRPTPGPASAAAGRTVPAKPSAKAATNRKAFTATRRPNSPRADSTARRDSSNRYFEAYRNVRIYSDSMQAVGDSLFYSFRDSIFRLFKNPVVWNKKNQVTGDTIYLHTRNKKADRIRVFNNSFLTSQVQPGVYNQVKGSRLDGYFRQGTIDSVRFKGSAESVYFLQDNDIAFTGINQTSADILDIRFRQGDLHRVIYRSAVKGTVWPIRQKNPREMRLPGFGWFDARRPKSKYELFQ